MKKGYFANIAPIWVNDYNDTLEIEPRGISGKLLLFPTEIIYGLFTFVASIIIPEYEPTFPILIEVNDDDQ